MTDAPERIWAAADIDVSAQITDVYAQDTPDGFVSKPAEYLRADLVPRWSTDMDAAPKDGSYILTFSADAVDPKWNDPGIRVLNWTGEKWNGFPWGPAKAHTFTHWMPLPLPAPPKGET
jgi:hypothetical protein